MTMFAPATRIAIPEPGRPEASRARSTPVACSHCGLDVPPGRTEPGAEAQFCCDACRLVYQTIHACGLDQYYALRARLGAASPAPAAAAAERAPARPARAYSEFDDPAFLAAYATRADPEARVLRTELLLEGVHCAACLWLVERLPRVVAGVRSARLDLRRTVVSVEWEPGVLPLSRVAGALASLGYRPHPVPDSTAREARRAQDRAYLIRIGVAAACAGNAMLLAFALYSGEGAGMHPAYAAAFRWLSAAIGVVSLAWPGRVFIDSALGAIRARTWHLDMPIALSLVVGNAAGLVAAARGTDILYADSLTMLVFLLLVGRWMQIRQQRYALDAVELLFSLTPGVAHVIDAPDAPARDVAVQSLSPGCLVEVRPQEAFPIDGVIVAGRTTVDSSILTGESRPGAAGAGDAVVAGAVNLASTVRVRATAVGGQTRAAKMMATIEELSRRRTPIIGSAQAFAAPFVFGVMLLSGLTVAIHAPHGLERAIAHAVALMVATCPCVIALATPLVVTLAVGRAARRGLLVKGGDVFERLARPGTIVLDKTGTLTTGRFQVLDWVGDGSLRPLVAAIERGSTHPVALALAQMQAGPHAEERPAEASDSGQIFDVEHVLGRGVVARRGLDTYHIGSTSWVSQECLGLPAFATEAIAHARRSAHTPIVVARNGRVEGVAILGDQVRPDAAGALDALRSAGWRVAMLSGDDPAVVAAVADRLGIEPSMAWGAQTPEDKHRRIADLRSGAGHGRRRLPVVMVGDGVNDAPALAAADVGIAVRGGAEASLAAADVYISRGGLARVPELAGASRRVLGAIRLCLGIALAYNLATAALAVGGLLSPLWAAVLMPISSMSVLAVAIRARTISPAGGAGGPA